MLRSIALMVGALLLNSVAAPALAEDCTLKLLASLDLKRDGDEFVPLVPVILSGQQKYMLIDTGSGFNMISATTADELALKRQKGRFQIFDVSNDYSSEYVTSSFGIGGMTADHMNLVVEPSSMTVNDSKLDSGLLGYDILSHFDVDIDFGTGKLNLVSPDHCEGKVVYWPASAVAVIPMTLHDFGHIEIPVKLDGQLQYAIVDTGAGYTTLTTLAAENAYNLKLGSPDTPALGNLQGHESQATYQHTFKLLEFEGVGISNPQIAIIPDTTRHTRAAASEPEVGSHLPKAAQDEVRINMLIGMNILRHLHIYIAYKEHKLYITPAGTPAATAESTAAAPASSAH